MLDYANSILYGIPAKHISRLQCTQNTLARVVTGKRYTDSSPSILKELHWLPIDARVKFKIATLIFKALNTGNPPYLASLLHGHTPCRTLRSASVNLLSVTRCNLSFGTRIVSVQLLLPSGIASRPFFCNSLNIPTAFKITPLSVQFPHCLATHLNASDSLRPWHYTNLLTYLSGRIGLQWMFGVMDGLVTR